eukprot:11880166-Alexandrium_andersonii.AAC.1
MRSRHSKYNLQRTLGLATTKRNEHSAQPVTINQRMRASRASSVASRELGRAPESSGEPWRALESPEEL